MNYKAYVASSPNGKNGAVCAVLIKEEESGHSHEKILALKNPVNEADLLGVAYVDQAVKGGSLEINVVNPYVLGLLDKTKTGKWSRKSKYKALAERLRNISSVENVTVVLGAGDDMEKAKWMSEAHLRLKDTPLENKVKMP